MPQSHNSTKKCSICKVIKPVSEFYRYLNSSTPRLINRSVLQSYCKPCQSEKSKKRRMENKEITQKRDKKNHLSQYGLTPERFSKLLKHQNYLCAICSSSLGPEPHIDHCHYSKIVRGALCLKCNVGLGMFKDSPLLLQNAIDYLFRSRLEYFKLKY